MYSEKTGNKVYYPFFLNQDELGDGVLCYMWMCVLHFKSYVFC
jgi:hypothetical protein